MDLHVYGLNHQTAPISIREKWAFTADEACQVLQGVQEVVSASENLILSTCNRTEIYSLLPGPHGSPRSEEDGEPRALADLLDYFHRVKNFRRERTPPHFYSFTSLAAVEHLFRVAAGLDSMIVGEGEILRQIRDAFETAQKAGSVGKVFLKLFPAALRVGKRTRTETGISHGCLTHGQAALKIAREALGDLKGRQILILGSGKIGAQVAAALKDLGAGRISIVNRTMESAERIAEEIGGEAFPLGDLPCLLEVADLAISSTGSPQPLVRADLLERIARRRSGRRLAVIDLAVPRDFEPACGQVPGIHLWNIDDLNTVVQESIQGRRLEVPRAEGIVQDELRSFFSQMNWIHLDPVIRHIVERFEAIRVAEVARHIQSIPEEHRGAVEALTSSLVKKVLHFPIEKLKSLRDDAGLTPAEIQFLRRLFLTPNRPRHEEPHRDDSQAPPDRKPR